MSGDKDLRVSDTDTDTDESLSHCSFPFLLSLTVTEGGKEKQGKRWSGGRMSEG